MSRPVLLDSSFLIALDRETARSEEGPARRLLTRLRGRRLVVSVVSVEEILEAPYVLIGTVEEMVEALHARRARWGLSYFVTFEPYMENLAPVVARLTGK